MTTGTDDYGYGSVSVFNPKITICECVRVCDQLICSHITCPIDRLFRSFFSFGLGIPRCGSIIFFFFLVSFVVLRQIRSQNATVRNIKVLLVKQSFFLFLFRVSNLEIEIFFF